MKSGVPFLVLAAFAQVAAQTAPIQFSGDVQEYKSEGILYHRLVFQEDKRQISYQPPAKWECRTIDNHLKLIPPGKAFAEAEISAFPTANGAPQFEATTLTQQVVSGLP